MNYLLHHFIDIQASINAQRVALEYKGDSLSYGVLKQQIASVAAYYQQMGLKRGERVAVYAPKRMEAVVAMFATSAADAVFVPVNPVLKAEQVQHILSDCDVKILVTPLNRLRQLVEILPRCPFLSHIVVLDYDPAKLPAGIGKGVVPWKLPDALPGQNRNTSLDVAAILYTSGSTGRPKGVVLSHLNMMAGATSVAQYLKNTSNDRILSVLPLSFDYGLSQLTTAFSVGARCVLLEYLLPRDVILAVEKYRITGLAAVPPLWIQLSQLGWTENAKKCLRYITNSGGAMPLVTTRQLQKTLPTTSIYLMYGLTEAFRSTYLPPELLDAHPASIGKAIPNAEILVVRTDGSLCDVDEPGELVHRGPLVSLGYWNDEEKTRQRFKPMTTQEGVVTKEMAVWSGDTVKRDKDGLLYFVGRQDEMIKTSGYRVSPTEIEDILYELSEIREAIALGMPHTELGQAVVVVVTLEEDYVFDEKAIIKHCQKHLPNFMMPSSVYCFDSLPRNPNGKIDRKLVATRL